jgi:hypothetical protein
LILQQEGWRAEQVVRLQGGIAMASRKARTRSHQSLRFAVLAVALGVAGCFTAAFTFADQPAQAAEVEQQR